MKTINPAEVKRTGSYIKLGNGRTAIERTNSLEIREKGKTLKTFKGSAIGFNSTLTQEDKNYLAYLASF